MHNSEETEDLISRHLQEWISATQNSPINKNVEGFLRIASSALDVMADTRVASFIYDYESGKYSYFNDYFPILMCCDRQHISEVGIRVMQERVHPEDFIKCLNITRNSLAEFANMKEMERDSTQLRLFYRLRKVSGEYTWVMQSNRQVRWDPEMPTLDLAYLIELFQESHPLKVMGILQTDSRQLELYPDNDTELLSKLSYREIEVLRLIGMGLSSKEIAEKLVLSENTIKSHRRNVLRKLEVKNMIQAVGMLEKLF